MDLSNNKVIISKWNIWKHWKFGKNGNFEERLQKCDRGNRKKKVDSELSLRELKILVGLLRKNFCKNFAILTTDQDLYSRNLKDI